jgi:hypothetical protein
MDYVQVSSSNVAAVGYDDDTNTLGVRFLNGTEYHYLNVPKDVFEGLKSASSVGTYLNQYIKKGGYSYSRVG